MKGSILEVVKADPADELAWLALADWLEEQGQPGPAQLHRLSALLRRPGSFQRGPEEKELRQILTSGQRPVMPVEAVKLGRGVELTLALIPPGSFSMGSPDREARRGNGEGPIHQVTLTSGFYLGVHAVTQAQWERLMGSNPSRFRGEDRPVERVSWDEGVLFCSELTRRTGYHFRLPTEAEWEYACRAGTTTPFHFGATLSAKWANYNACYSYGPGKKGTFRQHTKSVGSFPPNAFGLFDMHGNVNEWCLDAYDVNFYRESPPYDPRCYGGAEGSRRVLRGGAWSDEPALCRSANRSTSLDSRTHGFRVVMELP